MKEIISYLNDVGHALGIGGFEGVIGALVITLAALVIVVHLLSLLRKTGTATNQNDGHGDDHLEWMKKESDKIYEMITSPAYKSLHCNIWHKKDK